VGRLRRRRGGCAQPGASSGLPRVAAALLVVGLTACASAPQPQPQGQAHTQAQRDGPAEPGPTWLARSEPLAPGVHLVRGRRGEPSPQNLGAIGNEGILVGTRGSVIVGTGSSLAQGRALIAEAERLGQGRPVLAGIVTQPWQEFVMGGAAFAERGIPVLAHARTAALVSARCHTCLANLQRQVGEAPMRGTQVIAPASTFTTPQRVDLGDRRLLLWHGGWGASPGDVAVFDEARGVLFAGGLVATRRVPELRDAVAAEPAETMSGTDLAGWRRALDGLEALAATSPVRVLVPGHGPPGTLADLGPLRAYFDAIEQRVTTLIERGASLLDASREGGLPAYAGWDVYATQHPRNVQQLYLQREAEGFRR
jgi:glyoxylase-like metal-dependent hydrolase (beta-lactamase superfamily II)